MGRKLQQIIIAILLLLLVSDSKAQDSIYVNTIKHKTYVNLPLCKFTEFYVAKRNIDSVFSYTLGLRNNFNQLKHTLEKERVSRKLTDSMMVKKNTILVEEKELVLKDNTRLSKNLAEVTIKKEKQKTIYITILAGLTGIVFIETLIIYSR
jgi:hypothetical protein